MSSDFLVGVGVSLAVLVTLQTVFIFALKRLIKSASSSSSSSSSPSSSSSSSSSSPSSSSPSSPSFSLLSLSNERDQNKSEKKGREVILHSTAVESGEWFNKIIERIFLSCRDSTEVKQSIISSLNHEFFELQKKTKLLDKMVVQSFDLGTRPPELWAVNVEKAESIAAADLSVIAYLNYIGQVSLGIEVTILLPSPIGMMNVKAKVTIVELSTKVRVKMFLQEGNPFLSISLTEDPHLSLDIDFAFGDKDKPPPKIVENSVRSFIKTALNKALVEPNGKVFPLNEEMILDEKKGKKKKLGRLQMFIKEATDLAIADRNGLSDPYCVVKVGREEKRTKIIPKNLNPKWNQTLLVDVYEGSGEVALLVFDHDMFSKNDFLGEIVIPLPAVTDAEVLKTEPLQFNTKRDNGIKVKGTLTFSAKYEAEGSYKEEHGTKLSNSKSMDLDKFNTETSYVLGVEVKEAKNLYASDSNGFSDPYCVVTVGTKSKKTKTIQKNLNPKWNQKFAFTSVDDSIDGILFSVFDWDFGTKDDFLGAGFIPFSELEADIPLSKVINLLPRENHPQDNYVKGNLSVRVVLEKVPAGQKEIWRKAYLGGAERPDSRQLSTSHSKDGSRDDEQDNETDDPPEVRVSLDRQSDDADNSSLHKPSPLVESIKSLPDSPKGKATDPGLKPRGTISKLFHRSSHPRASAIGEFHSPTAEDDAHSLGDRSDKRKSINSFDMGSSLRDSDSNSTHSLSGPVILSGTLNKLRSGIIKKWQPRSFDLRESTLHLHDPEASAKNSKTLMLSDVTKIEPVPEKKFGKKHVLLIETKDKASYYQTTNDADFIFILQHIGDRKHSM